MAVTIIFSLLFALILLLLIAGSYHRSVVAMLGALLVIAFGEINGVFFPDDALNCIVRNADAVLLILCEALGRSGLFQFI